MLSGVRLRMKRIQIFIRAVLIVLVFAGGWKLLADLGNAIAATGILAALAVVLLFWRWRTRAGQELSTRLKPIFLHIGYSAETATAPPNSQLLDNRDSAHNDWREYWPMRCYLESHHVEEDRFIGFFSPKFREKTGLSFDDLEKFVAAQSPDTEVILISPQGDMGALFPNVFLQGDFFDHGFLQSVQEFIKTFDPDSDLDRLWMDSSNVVFSNYIVAKPRFWKRWAEITGHLYDICEGAVTPLQQELTHRTNYPGAVERKVFVMERMASYILATDPSFRTVAFNPFVLAISGTRLGEFQSEAVICDALKMSARLTSRPEYLSTYFQVRDQVFRTLTEENTA